MTVGFGEDLRGSIDTHWETSYSPVDYLKE